MSSLSSSFARYGNVVLGVLHDELVLALRNCYGVVIGALAAGNRYRVLGAVKAYEYDVEILRVTYIRRYNVAAEDDVSGPNGVESNLIHWVPAFRLETTCLST